MSVPYSFSQVRRSLVASSCVLGLASLAFIWNGVWLASPVHGLGFLLDDEWLRLPITGPMSSGGGATLLKGANAFCAVTFILLPLLCGLIGTYRVASKLRLSRRTVALLLFPSIFPPTALVTQLALLWALLGAEKSKADLVATIAPRTADASPGAQRLPWICAAICLVIYLTLQVQIRSMSDQAQRALTVREEMWTEARRLGEVALESAIYERAWANQDLVQSLQARKEVLALEEAMIGLAERHDKLAPLSNIAFLSLLFFAGLWGAADFIASRQTATGRKGSRNSPVARVTAFNAQDEVDSDGNSPSEYFLIRDGQRCGPYSRSVLGSLIASEAISETDVCWAEGWLDWKPIAEAFGSAAGIQGTPSKPAVKWKLKPTGSKEAD